MLTSLQLILAWLGVGLVATLCGFVGLLNVPLLWLLAVPIFLLLKSLWEMVAEEVRSVGSLLLIFILTGIWFLHGLGILVPETAFDAVWYHLPVLAQFAELGRITYLPELYQSANPLLVDMIFFLGYQLAGELGAKAVAWLLGLSLLVIAHQVAKRHLARPWLWLFLLTVSLIQPIAWQSSSFYVDIGKALWELAAVYVLLTLADVRTANCAHQWQRFLVVGLLVGASIATKVFSLLLLPLFVLMAFITVAQENKIHIVNALVVMIIGMLAIAAPYYLYTWLATGNPLIAVSIHLDKLDEIGGQSQPLKYVFNQTVSLPYSLWYLVVKARDSVSLLIGVGLPLAVGIFISKVQNYVKDDKEKLLLISKESFILLLFAGYQWLVWWFVPPVSTRYALSGFVVTLLLIFRVIQYQAAKSKSWYWSMLFVVAIVSGWQLAPRLFVASRNVQYLTGRQSKTNFIMQFYDGNIDQHLQKWHRLTK